MALPPDRPTDPLIDVTPPSLAAPPARTTVGNSARTLLLLGALAAIGVAIWWIARPSDLVDRIGAREWVVVEVDGEPAISESGMASTFVLDGSSEVRAEQACHTATGTWRFEESSQRLDIAWERLPDAPCPDPWPTWYRVGSGRAEVDSSVLRVEQDGVVVRSVDLDGLDPPTSDELSGRWNGGGTTVEIGPRGLLRVDECTGSWELVDDRLALHFDDAELARPACELRSPWADDAELLATRFDDSLFVRRDLPTFPLDRLVLRLDRLPDPGSPLLDTP